MHDDARNACQRSLAQGPRNESQVVRVSQLLELPSPFIVENGVIRLIEPHDASREALYERLLDGDYNKPFVLDDGHVRCLHFSLKYVQSAMRIDDPDALDLRYTQKMMGFLLFNPSPKNIVLLGLGGGSIAKFCYRHLPLASLTAVEIDPHVIALRDEFCIPRDDGRFQIVYADGARFVADYAQEIDVLLVDAYDRDGVALSLSSRDFVQDAMKSLAADGMLVVNLAGREAGYAPVVSNIVSVFKNRVLAVRVEDDGNHILFAFKNSPFPLRWWQVSSNANELRDRFGLEFPALSRKLEKSTKAGLVWRMSKVARESDRRYLEADCGTRPRQPRGGVDLREND